MRKTVLIAGLFLMAVVFVANPTKAHAAEQKPQGMTNPSKTKVKVVAGDSLSKIADKFQTTYVRLFDANTKIENPDIIHPGDEVRIPHPKEKLKSRPLSSAAVNATNVTNTNPSSYSRPTVQASPAVAPTPAAPVASGSVWDRLAQCESGGNWAINTGNGYYGGLQFSQSTWQAVGGQGLPSQNSREEQIRRGQILQSRSGWGQWPACSRMLGLI